MFSKVILFFSAIAAVAFASPMAGSAPVAVDQQQCGNGNTISCCNSSTPGPILGINCVAVEIIAVLDGQCSGNNISACCESGDQSGGINVNAECIPVGV